jgi:hypothetical protein
MNTDDHVKRPGGVTLLIVLGLIQGIAAIAGGIFLVIDRDNADLIEGSAMSEYQLFASGIGLIAVGTIMVLLASALGGGSNSVRWMFAISAMLNFAHGIWGAFALHSEQQMSAAFATVLGLVILWILFGNERTDTFFLTSGDLRR